MLSRRSIRVKVMQVLFAKNRDKALSLNDTLKFYQTSVDQTFEMFLLNIYVLINVARVALEDEKTRSSKYLPSEEDKKFRANLFDNAIISNLDKNESLARRFKKLGFPESVDQDSIQKIYSYFGKEEAYLEYCQKETMIDDDIEMLLELFRFCRASEFFNDLMEDHFYLWQSEKSIVIGSVKKVLKNKDLEENFYMDHMPDKITTRDFGEVLLKQTDQREKELDEMIVPTLENWDKDRVTILDMILIKMALSEFLDFETIPPRVTLNEYVELSKNYSTEKSKEFVNGVLDKLLKELEEKGLVQKDIPS